jgi:putative FmdB family regulatory protein
MPTYEYLCRACGHRFETWQHMSDEPLKVCPACGAEIHRVLFPAGIVFKGSGFYKTDNGKTDNGSSSAANSSSKTEKSNAAESKTESGASKSAAESSKSDSSGSNPSPATAAAD